MGTFFSNLKKKKFHLTNMPNGQIFFDPVNFQNIQQSWKKIWEITKWRYPRNSVQTVQDCIFRAFPRSLSLLSLICCLSLLLLLPLFFFFFFFFLRLSLCWIQNEVQNIFFFTLSELWNNKIIESNYCIVMDIKCGFFSNNISSI